MGHADRADDGIAKSGARNHADSDGMMRATVQAPPPQTEADGTFSPSPVSPVKKGP
jgi:hypothetical protein